MNQCSTPSSCGGAANRLSACMVELYVRDRVFLGYFQGLRRVDSAIRSGRYLADCYFVIREHACAHTDPELQPGSHPQSHSKSEPDAQPGLTASRAATSRAATDDESQHGSRHPDQLIRRRVLSGAPP